MKKIVASLSTVAVLVTGVSVAIPQKAQAETLYDYRNDDRTYGSNYSNALKYAEAISNSQIYIKQQKGDIGQVVTYNNPDHPLWASTGTTTAIGKHTLITAAHVVDKDNATAPHSPVDASKVKIRIKRDGAVSTSVKTIDVSSIKSVKGGDVAILHTKEDVSKYMKVYPIASESTIKNLRKGEPLKMYHYPNIKEGQYANTLGKQYLSISRYLIQEHTPKHPQFYFKGYAYHGTSGASVLNARNQIVGIHTYSLIGDRPEKAHLQGNYSLLEDTRKEVLNDIY